MFQLIYEKDGARHRKAFETPEDAQAFWQDNGYTRRGLWPTKAWEELQNNNKKYFTEARSQELDRRLTKYAQELGFTDTVSCVSYAYEGSRFMDDAVAFRELRDESWETLYGLIELYDWSFVTTPDLEEFRASLPELK